MFFHCNNGCTNAPQCYVMRSLPVLFCVRHFRDLRKGWRAQMWSNISCVSPQFPGYKHGWEEPSWPLWRNRKTDNSWHFQLIHISCAFHMKRSSLYYKLTRVHCKATVDGTMESKETLLGLLLLLGTQRGHVVFLVCNW